MQHQIGCAGHMKNHKYWGGPPNKSLSDIYPRIHTALKKAGYLRNNKLPKLGEILDKQDMDMAESPIQKEEWSKDKRSVYVMGSFNMHW